METFLVMNGFEIIADVDDAEKTILALALAAGDLSGEELLAWVTSHIQRLLTCPQSPASMPATPSLVVQTAVQ